MANDYFAFKRFKVRQSCCAMKVGTDGVLLGGWASVGHAKCALDIGTGTGLISLMLAQRNPNIQVKAIDIDRDAIWQASENVTASPFAERIDCEEISLSQYAGSTTDRFDLLVTNPPFFTDSLKSPDSQRSLARHDDSLSLEELISKGESLLTEDGCFAIVYPYTGKDKIAELAYKYKLFIRRMTAVYPTPTSSPKRILVELGRQSQNVIETELIIEKQRHVYSDDFIDLLKDFYLKF